MFLSSQCKDMADSFKERLYDVSPVLVQNMMISLQGAIFRRQRFTGKFWTYLEEAEGRASLGRGALESYQIQALNDFVKFSYQNSPYYRKTLDKAGFVPDTISSLADIQNLPILEKEDLRQFTDEIRTRLYPKDTLIPIFTSGTTGKPISVGFTHDDMQIRMAFLYRMLGRFGVKPFMRSVRFSGRTLFPRAEKNKKFWRMNYAANQLLMSSYNLKNENFDAYIKKLQSFKPELIDGYPSSIYVLARYMNSMNLQGAVKPRLIMTTAETLEDYQRAEIKAAFGGCSICNQYASSEGAPFITEDEFGDLVINTDTGVIEVVKPGTDIPAKAGEIGEILVTSFSTHAYPLIRYRIGDTVEPSIMSFSKSMEMPTVKKILGRREDILFTPYRGYVGRLDTVFKASPSTIIETQIVQMSPTSIHLNVVPDKKLFKAEDLDVIKKELKDRLGDVDIKVKIFTELPRGKNGKLRAVIGLTSMVTDSIELGLNL